MAESSFVVVLAKEWDRGDDPVTFYGTDPEGCLDFSSQPAKPRAKLSVASRKTLEDCDHHVPYDVVVCTVKP
jgi:hypothetical protein